MPLCSPYESQLIAKAREINNYKAFWCAEKVENAMLKFELEHNRKPVVAMMGLAFKPDIDDLRESPAKYITTKVMQSRNNADILVVEPNVHEHKRYQLRFIGKLSRNEIRIDGNTMASYAGTRLQDMNPRMLVGQFNQFPNIDAGLVANERQFVGESDLYVTGGVLGQFAHLRRFSICLVQGSHLKASVKPETSDVYLVVVPTPFKGNHEPDISYVETATRSVIPLLKENDLFIIESTSPVGTTDKMTDLIFSLRPELKGKIYIAYCPERVLPGNVIYELVHNGFTEAFRWPDVTTFRHNSCKPGSTIWIKP